MHTRLIADGGPATTFEEVVQAVTEAPYWDFVGGQWAGQAAAHASRTGDPILRFDQRGTGNRLEVTYRDNESVASEFLLLTILDSGFETNTGPFLDQLAQTHETIAEKYATSHVRPREDTLVAATGTLPSDIATLEVRTVVCSISAIGFEIARLHDRVRTPLEEYIGTDRETDADT